MGSRGPRGAKEGFWGAPSSAHSGPPQGHPLGAPRGKSRTPEKELKGPPTGGPVQQGGYGVGAR